MIVRVLKFLVGVLLLPMCGAAACALWDTVLMLTAQDPGAFPAPLIALILGMLVWLVAICVLPQPARSYIFAHELSHVLWAWLTGARVYAMRVGKDRGSVEVSESNFLIMLAPYFFPLYTVLVVAIYYLLALFMNVERLFLPWLFLIGVTYGFHLTFTISALQHHQTDVAKQGRLFSYVVILLMNLLGIALWMIAISDATLLGVGQALVQRLMDAYGWALGAIRLVMRWVGM